MKPSLQLRISQQLVMTPQLQQALRLLQMPLLELNTQLEQALAENVMLEAEEPTEATEAEAPTSAKEDDAPAVVAREADEISPWDEPVSREGRADLWSNDDRRQEIADTSDESLRQHLLWQLEMEDFSPREVAIGHTLIDALNEDGYLTETLEAIQSALATEARFSLAEIEQTLSRIQTLDPAGVGARDLAECIGIQLRQLATDTPGRALALRIAADSLDLVAEQAYGQLRRDYSASEDNLSAALLLIRACHPRPGASVQPDTTEYVVPDIYVRKQDGRWVVELNRSFSPRLRVNQTYADLLKTDRGHDTLRAQLQEARFLVRSLEIRDETLMKVALSIIERQTAFLEHGEEQMKPMILKDVAEAVGMHESTISRVTANKYMHTPRGVLEFRYFFSSQLPNDDGSGQSSTAIKARIRRLIGQENPANPMSDNAIAKVLAGEGVSVARRTVAKYREVLRIGTSAERKRQSVR
jgi:RNA polymerase sigma-54 factor